MNNMPPTITGLRNLPLLIFSFWNILNGVQPLKNVQVVVPTAVVLSSQVTLSCLYDLEHNESLYTVKWYLGEEEFFRYVPKEVPPIQLFPIAGLEIDTFKSDSHSVILKSVRHSQSGRYRCEVSADAPFFDTDMRTGHMTVVEFPDNSPLIEVGKHRYEAGERIRANCSFGPSKPPSNITWFINNVQVSPHFTSDLPLFEDGNQRAWVKSSLETDTELGTFQNGQLKLKCIASVYSVYHSHSEIQIGEEKPRSASVLGQDTTSNRISIHSQGNEIPEATNDASTSPPPSTPRIFLFSLKFPLQLVITLMPARLITFSTDWFPCSLLF